MSRHAKLLSSLMKAPEFDTSDVIGGYKNSSAGIYVVEPSNIYFLNGWGYKDATHNS